MEAEERPAKLAKTVHAADDQEALFSAHDNSPEQPQPAEPKDVPAEEPPADKPEGTAPPPVLDADGKPLSKSALKKLRRKQEWEAGREERRRIRKEKIKAKKERKREEYQDQLAAAAANPDLAPPEQRKKEKGPRAKQLPITFLFDCDFDELMNENELVSLASQLTRCYSDNKKSRLRAHLAVASFGGKLKERFDTVLAKNYESWKGIRFFEEDFCEVAEKAKGWMRDPKHGGQLAGPLGERYKAARKGDALQEGSTSESNVNNGEEALKQEEGEVIYLSADSDNTLTELKPYSTYIIGALVDKNRHKGICHKRAMEKGVKTAKLPIGEFLKMQSRAVLATNHVNDLMLKWLAFGDWGQAFMEVMPKRKGATLKEKSEGAEDAESESRRESGHNEGSVEAQEGPEESADDSEYESALEEVPGIDGDSGVRLEQDQAAVAEKTGIEERQDKSQPEVEVSTATVE